MPAQNDDRTPWPVLSLPERLEAHPALTGRGVCIGFIDVGFYPHPDLLWPERRVRAYADVTRDAPDPAEFFSPQVFGWHGTMTACAAAGNGFQSGGRYRGLASESDVVLIKAGVEGGRVRGKHVAAALRFPLRHPEFKIRVLNVSLGVDDDDPDAHAVLDAVRAVVAAGIVVVAAAGNTPGAAPEAPGSAREAITVGGISDGNTRETGDDSTWPSSAGHHKPDLLAPACLLPAPMLPGTLTAREAESLFQLRGVLQEVTMVHRFSETRVVAPEDEVSSADALLEAVERRIERGKYIHPSYQHVDGTSFAAPIATSVVAQMLQADPNLTPAQIREGLLHTAEPFPRVPRALQGAGVLRPRHAAQWAIEYHGNTFR